MDASKRADESPISWPEILTKLSFRQDLSAEESTWAMEDMLAGKTSEITMSAFLMALRTKGETITEMSNFALVMSKFKRKVTLAEPAVDTCGTGGDRRNTINVSTGSALIVAGAGGKVCKHGGRAASSKSGSADVLEALGVSIDVTPQQVRRCVEDAGIGFCFAPSYHPAMAHVAPVRRELKVPTAFNFLGPLVNPANTPFQLVGVSDPKMVDVVAGVLRHLGAQGSLIVYGEDGLDEISLTASTHVTEITTEGENSTSRVIRYEIDPRQFGFRLCSIEDLTGASAEENADELIEILGGSLKGPKLDILLINAGAALYVSKVVNSIGEGIELAREAVNQGSALRALERLVVVSNEDLLSVTDS